ncbi:MAG: hypothetical protein AAGM38_11690 [Pseudomonadota bacterium]
MTFVSDEILDADAFWALAKRRGETPKRARKAAKIAARRAAKTEPVVSHWNGEETRNVARPGDYIATSLDAEGRPLRDDAGALNRYVIAAETFERSYTSAAIGALSETQDGAIYAKTETVLALPLPEGFDIQAPWGERQRAEKGYLLLSGAEVYGNQADTFEATYEVLEPG